MATRLQGRRVGFRRGWPGKWGQVGDYCKVPDGIHPGGYVGVWYAVVPDGTAAAVIHHHTVTEHEDGTITLTPSIVAPSGWHGFLEHGVWRSV